MSAKIVLFFTLLCIAGVAVNNAAKLKSVAADINLLKIQINSAIGTSNRLLSDTNDFINNIVYDALNTIIGSFRYIEDLFEFATYFASTLGVDVSSCVDAFRDARNALTFNFDFLEDCCVYFTNPTNSINDIVENAEFDCDSDCVEEALFNITISIKDIIEGFKTCVSALMPIPVPYPPPPTPPFLPPFLPGPLP